MRRAASQTAAAPWPATSGALRPALQGVLALALYLAVFLVGFALPLANRLDVPKIVQSWPDPNFYIWALRWWPYAISHGINPLYSHQLGAPGGYNLAWATTTPSAGLLMWPVTAAFGPVVSYNLLVLVVPPLSALTAFVAARRLTGRFWAALLAGAFYGFCPYAVIHDWQGQLNITLITLLPLLVYLVLLWWDGTLGRTGFVCWTTVVMALEFYTFNEAFAGMTVVGAGALVIGFAVADRAARRKVARLAALIAIAYAGAIAVALPYIYYALRHYPAVLARPGAGYSLRLVRLILPVSGQLFGITRLVAYSNSVPFNVDDYVGIPILVVLLALAVLAWSSRITRLLVVTFALVIALAAGPVLMVVNRAVFALPWGRLWSLPAARSAEPSRLIVFGYLVLAIALALWLAAPALSRPARAARWCLGLLAVAAVLADLPPSQGLTQPIPPGRQPYASMRPVDQLPAFITGGMYRQYLRPGETVVIETYRGNGAMVFQADAGFYFRIVGGFINESLTTRDGIPGAVKHLIIPTPGHVREFRSYLRTARIGAILVEQAWAEPWMGIFGKLGMPGTSAGGVTVYPVAPWLARHPASKLAGHPVRRLAGHAISKTAHY